MLKTHHGDQVWLVHQPDHARVSGYLAAHWGNADGFARPGHFAASPDPARLRQEVVQAIAEHDNGWWEWEASPSIDPDDGLPRDLPDVSKEKADAGLDRWRMGVPRLAQEHPYVALLISLHAYWLYAFAFDDLDGLDNAFRHPLFAQSGSTNKLVAHRQLTRTFLTEQLAIQRELSGRLEEDPFWAAAVTSPQLLPHVRLLQVMDALSLLISFGGEQGRVFSDIPRGRWDDRVSMSWKQTSDRRIVCDPYPWDIDPLEVYLPVRMLPAQVDAIARTDLEPPLVRLHAAPMRTVRFLVTSR